MEIKKTQNSVKFRKEFAVFCVFLVSTCRSSKKTVVHPKEVEDEKFIFYIEVVDVLFHNRWH